MGELLKDKVERRVNQLGIKPHENRGQHFLINDQALEAIVSRIVPGSHVIEVGAGVGQVTEAIANVAGKTTGIEIDLRYAPILDRISQDIPNVEVVYGDALTFPWKKYNPRRNSDEQVLQVVASLPYHISDPFLRKLVTLNIDSAVLVLGKKLIDEISAANPDSMNFGTLSLLAQSFFDTLVLQTLERDDFIPPPKTKSGIVELIPKSSNPGSLDRKDFVFRALFSSQKKNPSIASVLKDAILEFESVGSGMHTGKRDSHRKSRRDNRHYLRELAKSYRTGQVMGEATATNTLLQKQTRVMDWLQQKGITELTLHKPFRLLDNSEMRRLAKALG